MRPAEPSPLDEVGFERLPVEPLEDHPGERIVRRKRRSEVGRGLPQSSIQDLHDRWVLQLGDGLGFARKSLALLGMVTRLRLEHLDGDGHVEHGMMPRVHHAEAPLGHEPIDAVLAVEKSTGQTKWMRS